jgi:hypothetical protein
LSFESQAVVVSGMTAGGEVAVFGVSRGFNGFTGYFLRHDEVVADADGDGVVRVDLELPLEAVRSAWAAVDLASGEVGIGVPEGTELLVGALPRGAIGADGAFVTAPVRRWAHLLWVRPGREEGAGAWGAIVGDGGANDDDGAEDRSVRGRVESFTPIAPGGSAPPAALADGDVVLVADPETLEITTARLSG